MTDFSPTAYYLPWTTILNNALIEFFKAFNSSFTKNEKGWFVFSAKFEKVKIKKWFSERIAMEILDFFKKIDENSSISHVFIVNTCKINDNAFSNCNEKYNLSFKFLEEDIHLDMVKLEDIFDRIFNQYFSLKIKLENNFRVVKHKNIPASTIRSLILKKYGKKHFVDLEEKNEKKKILVDLNDGLEKKIQKTNQSVELFIKELKEKYEL